MLLLALMGWLPPFSALLADFAGARRRVPGELLTARHGHLIKCRSSFICWGTDVVHVENSSCRGRKDLYLAPLEPGLHTGVPSTVRALARASVAELWRA